MKRVLKENLLKVSFSFPILEMRNFLILIFTLILSACNPSFEQEQADLGGAEEKVQGNFTVSLFSATTPSQPQFLVRGDLLIGQKIRLYTGNNCNKLRDVKTVNSQAFVQLYSSPLINNGLYTYKIRVESRDGGMSPCLRSNVRYNFTNGYQLPAPTLPLSVTNVERRPEITVTGAQQGKPVDFYLNSTCTNYLGSAIAGVSGEATFRPPANAPLADGIYNFHAKTVINGETIRCSDASATYTIDSKIKTPALTSAFEGTDNQNTIRLTLSNLIANAKVFVYENSADCNSAHILESPIVLDPNNFVLEIGQKPDLSYHINQEKTYRFNFRQEVFPGSGASNLTPCSDDQLIYTYNITPQNVKIATGNPNVTNKIFSPSFEMTNFNNNATIEVFRNNACAAAPLTTYTFGANPNGFLTIPSDSTNNSLSAQPDGTYSYYFRQEIDGLNSTCAGPVNYTIETTPTLNLHSEITSPSSNPFPKFIATNISPDDDIDLYSTKDCTGTAINPANYSLTSNGGTITIEFTSPRTVTAAGEFFSLTQTISEAGNPDRTSDCSENSGDDVNYHVNSSSFSAGFASGQSQTANDSTPSFVFVNTLENSEIHIYEDATSAACETQNPTNFEEKVDTGSNANVTYQVTNSLAAEGTYKYYIREFLELGADDYYSNCIELTYKYDTKPKAFQLVSTTPGKLLKPIFKVSNIDNVADYTIYRDDDSTCNDGDEVQVTPDLATDTLSNQTWTFALSSELPSEGKYYFHVKNENNICSNVLTYDLQATPSIQLAPGVQDNSNDFQPEVIMTELFRGYFLNWYANDDCDAGEFIANLDMTADAPPNHTATVDLSNLAHVTSDGTYQISANMTFGGFTSSCSTVDYTIDGRIGTLFRSSPAGVSTNNVLTPTFEFDGLIPSTQVQLFSSEADCNAGTNVFSTLPAATNASADAITHTVDMTSDGPALPSPFTDGTYEIWARQFRGSNGYSSNCKKVVQDYNIEGQVNNFIDSIASTHRAAPYFGTSTDYGSVNDIEMQFFTDEDCTVQIPGNGSGVNIPGVDTDTYGFFTDMNDGDYPFTRSDEYTIYSRIVRTGGVGYTGTYQSQCSQAFINYNFNGIIQNVRFTSSSFTSGTNTFLGEDIPVINTPTPTFYIDNIIDPTATITMHVDKLTAVPAENDACEAGGNDIDAGYTGDGYRVDDSVIDGNGVYQVYFKQSIGNYNNTGPNFDCSEGFTFEVAGIPDDFFFANADFQDGLSNGDTLYIDGNEYTISTVTDAQNLVLTSNALTSKKGARAIKTSGLGTTLTGTVDVDDTNPNEFNVVGTGTLFLTELFVDDLIEIAGNLYEVASITDNLNLTVKTAIQADSVGVSVSRYREVIPGFVTITNGSPNVIGSNVTSPDNNVNPGILVEGVGDNLHVRVYGITDANYGGTPANICNDGNAVAISDYVDTDYEDNPRLNVLDGVKKTTIPINLNNQLFTTDDTFYLAIEIVGESVEDTPDEAAFEDCTPQALIYVLESTPSSIQIIGEAGTIINNHQPTFSFTNLITGTDHNAGTDISADHLIRAYHGSGDQATALAECGANTNHYASNTGGNLNIDSINGGAEFVSDGVYFVYFRQFHDKDGGTGIDDFSSDCIYDQAIPGNGIFSFELDGQLTDAEIISPATQPSFDLDLTINIQNYRDQANRVINVYNDPNDSTTCDGVPITTITNGSITEPSTGVYQFTLPRLTTLINVEDETAVHLYFNQSEDGYTSDCSAVPLIYNLDSTVELTFEFDSNEDNDPTSHTSNDPSPGLVIDMNTVINVATNTLEFHTDSTCSGGNLIDSVTDPHNNIVSGVHDLSGVSADGTYTIYVRQVIDEAFDYTGACVGPFTYTLNNNGGFVTKVEPVSFPLNPRYDVVTADDDLDINVYLNDPTCAGPAITTKDDLAAGTHTIDDIYLIADRANHQFYFQLDNDGSGYLSDCIGPGSASYLLDGKPTDIQIPSGNESNDPTPTFTISGVLEKASTQTILELHLDSGCGSANGSRTLNDTDISAGEATVTSSILSTDGNYTFHVQQYHDPGNNGYNIATDYASDCSGDNIIYTLDGKPTSVVATGAVSPASDPEPSYQLKNIYTGHVVDAYPSKQDCIDRTNPITVTEDARTGETVDVTLTLTADQTYQFSFRQRTADGGPEAADPLPSYRSNCTDEFEYILDRKPSSITFNENANVLEPSFDIAGTVTGFTVELYTSDDEDGDGCDTLRGTAGGVNGTTTVSASTLPLDRGGPYKFYARMSNGGDVTACTETFEDYNLDIRPDNITFDSGNPGKSIQPTFSMNNLIQGATVHLYYIDDEATAFNGFVQDFGCPTGAGITYLGDFDDSNSDGDIEAATQFDNPLIPDPDNVYPIYAYQTNGVFASRCAKVGDYELDIIPSFENDWLVENHTKSDVINIKLDNLVDGSQVKIYYDGCDASNELFLSNNTASTGGGDSDTFEVDLNFIPGLSDNTTYRFFARQILASGFDSGCTTLVNASYNFNSSPKITQATANPNPIKAPVLRVTELIQGTPRPFKIYAVPTGEDPCAAGHQLIYDGSDSLAGNGVDAGNGLMIVDVDLNTDGLPIEGDGEYTFKAVQVLDSTNESGCYVADNVTYTIDTKLTLNSMDPAGQFGSDSTPEFTLNASDFITNDGYTINAWVNDTTCSGIPDVADYTSGDPIDISGMGPFNSNYVFFNFKMTDFIDHTGTVDITNGSPTIIGTATVFEDEFEPDDLILIDGNIYQIDTINNDTSITLTTNASTTNTGIAIARDEAFGSCSEPIIYDYDALELSLITSSPNSDLSPLIQIDNVDANDIVRLYADANCSALIGSATAASAGTLLIETNPLTTDGTFEIHATREPSVGNTSLCSMDFVQYTIDIDPDTFDISSGNNVDVDTTPTFDLTGVLDDAQINLYRDANCTNLVGFSTTPFGQTTVSITSDVLPADGEYVFHVKQSKSGFNSKCSTISENYTLITKPSSVDLLQNNPSNDARPKIRVDGVAQNSTVNIFRDDGNGGDGCDTLIGTLNAGSNTYADVQINAGVLTVNQTINIYAQHEVGPTQGDCSDDFATYTYDTTAEDWSLINISHSNLLGFRYGRSVAIDNQVAVVGESSFNGSGNAQGQVTIYHNTSGDVWEEKASFQASNTENGDQFGYAVDISYDAGSTTYYIVVSAPFHDITAGNDNSGNIYVFSYVLGTETLNQEVTISPFDAAADDEIGHRVAINGDELVFSTITKNNGKGKVYYYRSSGANFDYSLETGLVHTVNADNDALFGNDVSLDDDYIIVGAPGVESAYVFDLNNSNQMTQLQAPTPLVGDEFGYSVGHNGNNIVIGVPGKTSDQGEAFIFDLADLEATPVEVNDPNPANNNRFGQDIVISNAGIVAVSATGANSNQGKIQIFDGVNFDVESTLIPFDVQNNLLLGSDINFDSTGKTLIIGGPSNNSSIEPGMYIYRTP